MTQAEGFDRKTALAFVVAFGFVSLFADAAYEGMRGISGPFLALLGASGAAVGIIAGGGELIGYLLRLVSGRLAERTHAYWTLTIGGYAVQMAAVPLLAFAASWQAAALLIVLERAGKALRKPAVSFMLSRAGGHIGQGWAFGLHEAMDQAGAMAGPLIAALVLAGHGDYRTAFLWLGVPAALTVVTVLGVRARHGHVSYERLLAGFGLQNIYGWLAMKSGRTAGPAPAAETIVNAAQRGDAMAGDAIAIFARILGSFVGDIVLATGTFDGVYLVSPLLGALRPALTDDRFRAAMIGKGRLKKALEPVAVGYAEGRSPRLRGMAAALAARSAASGEPVAPARA